jgi:multidrug efflux pump subunit AcrA (membrane-fusion protein)
MWKQSSARLLGRRPARWFTVFAAGMLVVSGCSSQGAVEPSPSASAAKTDVVQPKRQSLNRVVEQPGSIEAYEVAQRYARVPGYVRLPYDDQGRLVIDIGHEVRGPKYDASGKEVELGQVLAEVDVPELVQQTKLKQATVVQTKSDVEQAEKALAAAAAAVTIADATVADIRSTYEFWEVQEKKFAGFVQAGTLQRQSHEEAQKQLGSAAAKLDAAKATVVKAKADRDKAEADVKSAKARIAVAEADARNLEAMLSYATIRAPIDGIVTRRKVSNGELVQPGGKDDWLFTIARLDPVRVVVAVPEVDAELVRNDLDVQLTIQALPGGARTGKVVRTSWDLEPGSRTLRTEIDLPNPDHALRPGMYVYARITCPLPEAWVLPVTAVAKQDNALVCFRIVENKAVRTPVQVGRGDGEFLQVLKYQSGGASPGWESLTGKERVAVKATGLTDGQSVQVEPK